MIYFIWGPDQYRARLRLSQIRQEFLIANSTDADVTQLVAGHTSVSQLAQTLTSGTLFAVRRLVILEDLLSAPEPLREEFLKLATSLSPDVELVIFETDEPDKRFTLYKWVNQHATNERFDYLTGSALRDYVMTMAKAHSLTLTDVLANRLITLSGTDLWRMDQEMSKLGAYAKTQPLTNQAIEQLISANLDNDIFGLIESINRKNLPLAHRQLSNLTQRGEDPIGILAVLTWQIRNLIRISDLNARGKSAGEIVKITGLHPYAVTVSLKQTQSLPRNWLISAYQLVTRLDWRIKQGDIEGLDATNWLITTLAGNRPSS